MRRAWRDAHEEMRMTRGGLLRGKGTACVRLPHGLLPEPWGRKGRVSRYFCSVAPGEGHSPEEAASTATAESLNLRPRPSLTVTSRGLRARLVQPGVTLVIVHNRHLERLEEVTRGEAQHPLDRVELPLVPIAYARNGNALEPPVRAQDGSQHATRHAVAPVARCARERWCPLRTRALASEPNASALKSKRALSARLVPLALGAELAPATVSYSTSTWCLQSPSRTTETFAVCGGQESCGLRRENARGRTDEPSGHAERRPRPAY